VALTTPDGEVKHFTAKHILIATGGRAVLLDIPGKVGDSKETGLCFYVMCSLCKIPMAKADGLPSPPSIICACSPFCIFVAIYEL
jgi:hypothetical protein